MTTYQLIRQIEDREARQLAEGDKVAEMIRELKDIEHRELYGLPLGYHTPASANWSYRVELVRYGGLDFQVVKSFGRIIHAAYVSIFNYDREGGE